MLRVFDDGDDLGDDVAAALDLDEVADADAEAGDLVGVVQGGAGDGGAADEDRHERGDGGDLAGAADLEVDAFEPGDAGARGELVGDGPARGLAGEAEAALLRGGVDLDDDAIDLVAERVAEGFGLAMKARTWSMESTVAAWALTRKPAARRASRAADWVGRSVSPGCSGIAVAVEEEVGVEVEAALGDDVGLEGADGAGGGVARVGRGGEALASRSWLSLRKADWGRTTSPRTSKLAGRPAACSFAAATRRGTERMVRTFEVTSSPMAPSPRVRPRWRWAEPSGAGA